MIVASQVPPETWLPVDHFLAQAPVDEATVWLQTEDGESLVAIYNPVNDVLPGLRQPLTQGLISQVFATGLALLERDVRKRSGHDSNIDSITGSFTRALLAAPIAAGNDLVGVVSAVQLAGGRHARDLNDDDLASLHQLATALGRALSVQPDQNPTTDGK